MLALGAVLGVLVGGGGDSGSATTGTGAAGGPQPAGAQRDPVQDTLDRMSLRRKVAQVFLWGFVGQGADAPVRGRLRALDLGGVVVARGNYANPGQLRGLTNEVRGAARRARHVRPWVMTSQSGGDFNSLPGLPPDDAPSDLPSTRAGARQALAAGRALRGLGVDGVMGPSLDVGGPSSVAVDGEAFDDDPGQVARYGQGVVDSYRRARVFSAPSHFPGLGSASQAPEEGPASVSLSAGELRRQDLVPFRTAVDAGAPGILIANGLYTYDDFVTPASLSRSVMTGVLRRQMGFRGVAITGNLTDPAVTALFEPRAAAVQALKAGADMLTVNGPASDQEAAYRAVLRAVRTKKVSRQRLDEAVRRILSVKRDYGLLR